MQHLIKRRTGPLAEKGQATNAMTLAERLAANRKASQTSISQDEPELDAEAEIDTPEDVLELTDLASEPRDEEAPADSTEAIVKAAKAARDGSVSPSVKGKICLVIDDSRVIRKVAHGIASGLGFTVVEAENGEEALVRCKAAMPHLVLTDWDMPVMDGPTFVAAMRKLPGADAVKVVFCTSKGEAEDIHKGIDSGADDYVVKPFNEKSLTAKLRKLGVI